LDYRFPLNTAFFKHGAVELHTRIISPVIQTFPGLCVRFAAIHLPAFSSECRLDGNIRHHNHCQQQEMFWIPRPRFWTPSIVQCARRLPLLLLVSNFLICLPLFA